jgi:hypothetical protein
MDVIQTAKLKLNGSVRQVLPLYVRRFAGTVGDQALNLAMMETMMMEMVVVQLV